MQIKEIRIIKKGDKESDYDIEKLVGNAEGKIFVSRVKNMALIDILQTELLPFFGEKELEARWTK